MQPSPGCIPRPCNKSLVQQPTRLSVPSTRFNFRQTPRSLTNYTNRLFFSRDELHVQKNEYDFVSVHCGMYIRSIVVWFFAEARSGALKIGISSEQICNYSMKTKIFIFFNFSVPYTYDWAVIWFILIQLPIQFKSHCIVLWEKAHLFAEKVVVVIDKIKNW